MVILKYIDTDACYCWQQIFRCSKPITKSLEYDDIKTHLEVYKERLNLYLEKRDELRFKSTLTNEVHKATNEQKNGIITQLEWVEKKLKDEDYTLTDIFVSEGRYENCIFSCFSLDDYKNHSTFDCALAGGWLSKLQDATKSELIDALMKANFPGEKYKIEGYNYYY